MRPTPLGLFSGIACCISAVLALISAGVGNWSWTAINGAFAALNGYFFYISLKPKRRS